MRPSASYRHVFDHKPMNTPESVIHLRTIDHPEANGRKPQAGDQGYTLIFPLEDGSSLRLTMGRQSYAHFVDFIGRMMGGRRSRRLRRADRLNRNSPFDLAKSSIHVQPRNFPDPKPKVGAGRFK